MRGLKQFEIEKIDVRVVGLSLEFEFFFKQLEINGQHTTKGNLVLVPISGSGPVTIKLNDIRVKGIAQLNTVSGTCRLEQYLNLESLLLSISVGSSEATLRGFGLVLDATISGIISAGLPAAINNNQDRINDNIAQNLVPSVNEILNQIGILDAIFSVIGGILPADSEQPINV